MKTIKTMKENMDFLFKSVQDFYTGKNYENDKILNFELYDNGENYIYCLFVSKDKIEINNKLSEKYDLSVKCNAMDWLEISGKRLNPIFAVLTGKLKLNGDSKLISKVFNQKSDDIQPWQKIPDKPADYEFQNKRKWKKPKKILAVCGAPGGKHGYTYSAMNFLIEGMKEAGADVETIILAENDIKHCTGCFNCFFLTEGKCVINDDMKKHISSIISADIIVYAFPLYVDGVPGLLKNFFDRSIQMAYPYFVKGIHHTRHPRRIQKERYVVALTGSGLPELNNFKAVIEHFKEMQDNRHTPILAHILFPQIIFCFNDPTAYPILLKKIEALKISGKQLIEKGKVDKKILNIIKQTTKPKHIEEWIYDANTHMQSLINEKAKEY